MFSLLQAFFSGIFCVVVDVALEAAATTAAAFCSVFRSACWIRAWLDWAMALSVSWGKGPF